MMIISYDHRRSYFACTSSLKYRITFLFFLILNQTIQTKEFLSCRPKEDVGPLQPQRETTGTLRAMVVRSANGFCITITIPHPYVALRQSEDARRCEMV